MLISSQQEVFCSRTEIGECADTHSSLGVLLNANTQIELCVRRVNQHNTVFPIDISVYSLYTSESNSRSIILW